MLALLLAMSGAKVYDAGSTVTLDTTSAVVPMAELRIAVDRLQDRAYLLEEVQLDSIRHQADSAALAHAQAGNGYQSQALDSLQAAETAADRARLACVDSAAVIEQKGEKQYRNGILVGGGVGAVAAVLAFVVGFLLR